MTYVLLALLLLSTVLLRPSLARPPQVWQFDCPPETVATMDVWIFHEDLTQFVQRCEGGAAQYPWPDLPDAAGNVWWIYLFIDINALEGYCELGISQGRVDGQCYAHPQALPVAYEIAIPNVE